MGDKDLEKEEYFAHLVVGRSLGSLGCALLRGLSGQLKPVHLLG